MRDHGFHIVGVDGVEDSVEVLPVRASSLWVLVLQVLHHFFIAAELLEDVFDTKFIIVRDGNELAICDCK